MPSLKSLVLLVEGEADVRAVPVLVKRLLTEQNAWGYLSLDPNPLRVAGIANLTGRKAKNWTDKLRVATKRKNVGGVLLLLDGDVKASAGRSFCARLVSADLSQRARAAGGGALFSVASVFALQEFESWLIAGVDSLTGKNLPDGRPGIKAGIVVPGGDLEDAPRDAKGWLKKNMIAGYKETADQQPLTELVDLGAIRRRQLRSFRRLENAIQQLVTAIRTVNHVVTP